MSGFIAALAESWWWIALFFSAWSALFLLVDKRRLGIFWQCGLVSTGIALAAEGLVRRQLPLFQPGKMLFPLLGADVLLFAGPRFVEGVVFTAHMPVGPAAQWIMAALWTGIAAASEALAVASGFVLPEALETRGILTALLVHGLRFLALVGVYHAAGYDVVAAALALEEWRRARRDLLLGFSRRFWPMSWVVFLAGAKVAERASRRWNRGGVKSSRRSGCLPCLR